MDQQRAQIPLTAFADPEQGRAPARRVLPRHQSKPSRHLPPGAEHRRVSAVEPRASAPPAPRSPDRTASSAPTRRRSSSRRSRPCIGANRPQWCASPQGATTRPFGRRAWYDCSPAHRNLFRSTISPLLSIPVRLKIFLARLAPTWVISVIGSLRFSIVEIERRNSGPSRLCVGEQGEPFLCLRRRGNAGCSSRVNGRGSSLVVAVQTKLSAWRAGPGLQRDHGVVQPVPPEVRLREAHAHPARRTDHARAAHSARRNTESSSYDFQRWRRVPIHEQERMLHVRPVSPASSRLSGCKSRRSLGRPPRCTPYMKGGCCGGWTSSQATRAARRRGFTWSAFSRRSRAAGEGDEAALDRPHGSRNT